ncbi:MAG: hypothetical protein MRY76_13005 [Pseudomonadales bacterium]|nr:hypothetical protein [Pseudomonadales bacterium]
MKKLTPFLVVLFLISPDLLLAQPAFTGRVISSQGEVTVLSANGQRTQPARGQQISINDEFQTGADGQLQIRFDNGLLLSLGCSSSLQLESGSRAGADQFDFLNLHRGHLRLVTGDRGTGMHYLRTSAGLLSFENAGSDLALYQEAGSAALAAVYNGSAKARTNAGEMVLGVGGDFDFAALEAGNPPTGLTSMPAALQAQTDCR